MRLSLLGLVIAVIATLAPSWALAGNPEVNKKVAQEIASQLKVSGKHLDWFGSRWHAPRGKRCQCADDCANEHAYSGAAASRAIRRCTTHVDDSGWPYPGHVGECSRNSEQPGYR